MPALRSLFVWTCVLSVVLAASATAAWAHPLDAQGGPEPATAAVATDAVDATAQSPDADDALDALLREAGQAVEEPVEPGNGAAGYDIDVPFNGRVATFVNLFTGRLKGYLEDALGRSVRYLPMIQEVFRAEGIPLDLAYVPLVESAFKTSALSRTKAKGLWQFMAGTGRENGLYQDWYVDERAEPEKATRAAAKYLKTLYDMFGDWHLALASYNGGPGRIQRAMARSGREDFWQLSSSPRLLPQETRDYVPLILAALIIAKNPAQYGLNATPFVHLPSETVTLPKAADLRQVATWAETSVDVLRQLNPELRRWTTPVRATDYQLRVPLGTADRIAAHLHESPDSEPAHLTWYTVRQGDTLLSVAKRLGVTRADLAEANYLKVKARVSVGQQLIVPRPPGEVVLAAVSSTRKDVPVRAKATPAPRRTTYVVQRGDTLTDIAEEFNLSIASLKTWNRLRSGNIRIGQRLRLTPPPAAR